MEQQQTTEPNQIVARPAVLHAVVTITRKATGVVEEYTIIGTAEPATQETQHKE